MAENRFWFMLVGSSELWLWIEKAGEFGRSIGELKCAVTPFDVWSIGVD